MFLVMSVKDLFDLFDFHHNTNARQHQHQTIVNIPCFGLDFPIALKSFAPQQLEEIEDGYHSIIHK